MRVRVVVQVIPTSDGVARQQPVVVIQIRIVVSEDGVQVVLVHGAGPVEPDLEQPTRRDRNQAEAEVLDDVGHATERVGDVHLVDGGCGIADLEPVSQVEPGRDGRDDMPGEFFHGVDVLALKVVNAVHTAY